MFSGGVNVALEYPTVPDVINDSLSKRTMKVANSRFVTCESARWTMVSNFDTYTKQSSHKLRSTRMVFLGILDFSNGEGGSFMMAGENTERTMVCHYKRGIG